MHFDLLHRGDIFFRSMTGKMGESWGAFWVHFGRRFLLGSFWAELYVRSLEQESFYFKCFLIILYYVKFTFLHGIKLKLLI